MRGKKFFILFTALAAVAVFSLVSAATAKGKTNASTLTKSLTKQKAGVEKEAAQAMKGKININKVDLDTLTQLKGIGPEKAKAILDYREKFGSFKNVEDLMKVKGIGEKTFNMIKPFLTVK